ncbi:MAG: translocation/assembly module TamB domain-containing protein [Paludibacteraceae bacterium]|nr:translocation/assembly module TamB domain-containing protein [Paludibacteraceae bacterium]
MRKALRIVGVILLIVGLITGSVALLLRSGRVQTAVIKLITEQLSEKLNADIQIRRFKFRFLNRLLIEDVYMSDQQGDTLIWIPRLDIRFNPVALRKNELDFTSVSLEEPYVSLWEDTCGANYGFLLDAFSPASTNQPFDMPLRVRNVSVSQARIHYNFVQAGYDVRVFPLDLQLRLPVYSADSVQAVVDRMSVCVGLQDVDAVAEGVFHGSPDSLIADELRFLYRGQPMLTGRFKIYHPLQREQLRTGIDCDDLYCNRILLQDLLSDFLRRPVLLPDELGYLGDIYYRGHIGGRLDNLMLKGAFLTDIGSLSTHAQLHTDTAFSDIRFIGKVGTQHLRLRQLLPKVPIGDLSMQSDVDLHYRKNSPMEGQGTVDIQSLVFKDYTYQDVRLQASLCNGSIQAGLISSDPNMDVNLNGSLLLNEESPIVNARLQVNHLRLGNLHLVPDWKDQDLQMRGSLSFSTLGEKSAWTDHLNGQLVVDSFLFTNYDDRFAMQQMTLRLVNNGEENSLQCLSDYFNANIKGCFRWTTLPQTLYQYAYSIFPRLMHTPPRQHQPNDLDFYCYILHADSIVSTLTRKDIDLPEKQTLKGFVRESQSEQGLQLYIPSVVAGKLETRDITFSMVQKEDKATLALSLIEHPLLNDSTRLKVEDAETSFLMDARRDSLYLTCRFSETDAVRPAAEIQVHTRLDRCAGKPFASIHILPSMFYMRDTLWTLNDARIEYVAADSAATVYGFDLSSQSQFIRANGTASPRMTDSIRIDMRNVSLGYIMRNFDLEKVITADGDMTGWVTLYSLFSAPMLEAKVHMPEGYLNNTLLGSLDATASLDRENNQILIGGIARQDNRTIVDLKGKVIPEKKYWELDMQLDSADLNLVNHWTNRILSDIGGRGYGRLGVYGRHHDTWVRARLFGKNAHLTVPATNVRYTFTDSVLLDTAYIAFPNISVRDDEGHYGTLDGKVTHRMFKDDFAYDLRINARNMLVLNLPYQPQQRVYGKVYATGDAHIYGNDTRGTFLDANASTRGKSDFYFNTGVASEAADNSFIAFVQSEENETKPEMTGQLLQKNNNPFLMNLNLDVTPAASVHLLFDSRLGDGISGKGEGNLRLKWDTSKSDVQLFGTYTLQQGLFSYTAANIIRRDFRIADGSSIIWSGNPVAPMLNVSARYGVTASLRDLFGNDVSQLTTNRTSVPVECLIYLSDRLTNPTLRFGIDLPHSDETVASQVKSVINSDEMLMRQVIYLLVFNRFFTPEYMQTTASGMNDTYSLISSTVTGQINSWLSRVTDMVTIGFNFRTDGEGASSSQEYETQFQIRPINRLSINGNVGYRYNDLSNRPFFGDVDIEYELTEDGKLRVKGFTHTVDKYSLKQANTVQGVGLIYRHDFNWGDARRKAAARRRQKKLRESENQTDNQKRE